MVQRTLIPFSFLPYKLLLAPSKKLTRAGQFVSAFFPGLHESLLQAEYEYSARDYAAIALTVALANLFALAILAGLVIWLSQSAAWAPAFALAILAGGLSFLTILSYPKIVARRRRRELDNQLIPALRQLLIELRSGVSLFNAMVSLTADYGEVSEEFRKIVRKINAGTSDLDALSEVTMSNPSEQFRKVLWQISNALKVGSDVSIVIQSQVDELTRERVDQIRRYGQELSPWTMIYMMAAVIVPSLGVAMLIVIVGFLNFPVPKVILAVILAGLAGFQLFFMNFVASRRPAI